MQLNDDVQMIPLGSTAREQYAIPFLPLTDDGDVEFPPSIQELCRQLSAGGDLAYIEAEMFGGAGVQASVLVEAGGKIGSAIVAHDAINVALRSLGIRSGFGGDAFTSLALGRYRETDAWVDSGQE
ncbi:hypothetical protein [Massilia aquatica]|uniref:Uncharacterized protein n=1 Tax=Massilia aquatica TaxID=2609000 RepID=A0ABX0MJY3_9BURK|nr:hypothetical protein [Massilia aquatica]NHZ43774.1 hypothetical protein [Massilia aquatica]